MTVGGVGVIMLPAMLSRRSLVLTVGAALLALPIAVLLLWAWERLSTEPSARFEGASFQVLAGEGGFAQGGLELRSAGTAGQGVLALRLKDLPAAKFGSLKFSVIGLDRAAGAGVYWNRKDSPAVSHARPLSLEEVRLGEAQIAGDARWRGDIQTFGLIVQGPLNGEVVLRSLGFVADSATFGEVTGRVLANWRRVGDWEGGSVNFYIGAEREERRLTPVSFSLTWLFATVVLMAISRRLGWERESEWLPMPTLVMFAFLVAWAVLDLRWQRDLWHRHFTPTDDSLVLADMERAKFWAEFRPRVLTDVSRMFIVSDDPSGYLAYRTRYHLGATPTSFGMTRLPSASERRPGDLILVLGSREPLTVDTASKRLVSATDSVPVTMLLTSPVAGTLFKILDDEGPK